MSDSGAPRLDAVAMLAALERHGVAFVAVGQLTAQWQGAERGTKDFDICPAWHSENLDRVAAALRDLGARLRVNRPGNLGGLTS